MSKHSASGSPAARGPGRACRAAGRALSTVVAACAPACSALASPPRGLHHDGRGQPASPRARRAAQVGGEQRRQRGVDLGRRRALVLAERAHGLVRERHVHAGRRSRAPRRSPARARGGGRRAAGTRRPPRARARRPRDDRRDALASSARSTPSGPIRSSRADAPLGRHQRGRVRRAQPVEIRARLAAELDDVLEALGGHERGPRALALEQRVGRDRRAVRERLDILGPRPRARARARRRRARPRTGRPAWSATSRSRAVRRRRGRRR